MSTGQHRVAPMTSPEGQGGGAEELECGRGWAFSRATLGTTPPSSLGPGGVGAEDAGANVGAAVGAATEATPAAGEDVAEIEETGAREGAGAGGTAAAANDCSQLRTVSVFV